MMPVRPLACHGGAGAVDPSSRALPLRLNIPTLMVMPKAAGPSHGTKHHGYGRARRTLVDEILILVENRKTLWLLGLRRLGRGPLLPAGVSRNFTRLYRSDGAAVLGGAR
jgi:hypothetical protein